MPRIERHLVRTGRGSSTVVADEMALFMQAASGDGGG